MPAIPHWVGAEKLINPCQGVGHGLPVGADQPRRRKVRKHVRTPVNGKWIHKGSRHACVEQLLDLAFVNPLAFGHLVWEQREGSKCGSLPRA